MIFTVLYSGLQYFGGCRRTPDLGETDGTNHGPCRGCCFRFQYTYLYLQIVFVSGAFSGLILDLGLFKISLGVFFTFFQPLRRALTLCDTILILFLTLQGKTNLTLPKICFNFIIFNIPNSNILPDSNYQGFYFQLLHSLT